MKDDFLPSTQKALVIGASGMAGQAFMHQLLVNNYDPIGISRNGPDICIDIAGQQNNLREQILALKPNIIINCAAIVSLSSCEENPKIAKNINSDLPGFVAECASDAGAKFVQISTDHFYTGDEDLPHSEDHPLTIVNNYAATKRLGELNALNNQEALVIRTNITGARGNLTNPTFIEWLISSIKNRNNIQLFTDFFTSTLDTTNFAKIVLKSSILTSSGVLNVASSTVASKKTFALEVANQLGVKLDWAQDSSVRSLSICRAESLGLDCSKAEKLIGSALPDLCEVSQSLALLQSML